MTKPEEVTYDAKGRRYVNGELVDRQDEDERDYRAMIDMVWARWEAEVENREPT